MPSPLPHTSLTSLDLEGCPLTNFSAVTLSLLPSLTHLNLAYVRLPGQCLHHLWSCCPLLQSLNLTSNDSLTDDICKASLSKLPHLTHLCIKHCPKVSDVGLEQFLPPPSNAPPPSASSPPSSSLSSTLPLTPLIRSIDLSRNKNVTDSMIIQLLKRSHYTLTELKARDCEKVGFTKVLLHIISAPAPRLRVLDLYNCGNRPGLTGQSSDRNLPRVFQTHTLTSLYQLLVGKPVNPLLSLISLDVGSTEVNVRDILNASF